MGFREGRAPADGDARREPVREDEASGDDRARYVCAACGATLAWVGDELARDGATRHVFANPGGYVHRFVTLARCERVAAASSPTAEHTWFAGYAWQVLACAGCGGLVGWRFVALAAATPAEFFALLQDRTRIVG